MEKVAVFTGTKNIYSDMVPAVKSLFKNSDVDKVILFTEDDVFPYELPEKCEVRNVRFQRYFKNVGPNSRTKFTYMAMMRAALAEELPEHDYVVSFDCDIIVDKPMGSYLWDLPLGDKYYFAAAREPHRCNDLHPLYCNIGVCAQNLKLIRKHKMAQKYIMILNTKYFKYVDQDVMNYFSNDRIYEISGDYNACDWTVHSDEPKIIHFAGVKREDWVKLPLVEKWRNMSWEDVLS